MNVVCGIVPHGLEVIPFQQPQLLEENRSLTPGAALEDLIAAVVDRHRRFYLGLESGEVISVEQSSMTLHKGGDLSGDIPCIKCLMGRVQTGRSPAGSGATFGLDEVFEGLGEIGIAEDRANFRSEEH